MLHPTEAPRGVPVPRDREVAHCVGCGSTEEVDRSAIVGYDDDARMFLRVCSDRCLTSYALRVQNWHDGIARAIGADQADITRRRRAVISLATRRPA